MAARKSASRKRRGTITTTTTNSPVPSSSPANVTTTGDATSFLAVLNGKEPRCALRRLVDAAAYLLLRRPLVAPHLFLNGQAGMRGPKIRHLMALRRYLEQLTLDDLGISWETLVECSKTCIAEGAVGFCNLLERPAMSLALFLISGDSELDMHGHPGMVVMTKVLVGKLAVQATTPIAPSSVVPLDGPPSPQSEGREFAWRPSLLPVDSFVVDYGAVPLVPVREAEARAEELCSMSSPFQSSPELGESALRTLGRRRSSLDADADPLLGTPLQLSCAVGSRVRYEPGDKLNVLEVFDGVCGATTLEDEQLLRSKSSPPLETEKPLITLEDNTGYIVQPGGVMWVDSMPDPDNGWNSTLLTTPSFNNYHRFKPEKGEKFVLLLDLLSPSYDLPPERVCPYLAPNDPRATWENYRRRESSAAVARRTLKVSNVPGGAAVQLSVVEAMLCNEAERAPQKFAPIRLL